MINKPPRLAIGETEVVLVTQKGLSRLRTGWLEGTRYPFK